MVKKVNVHIATSMNRVERMKKEGKEPIVLKENEHEVWVFARSESVAQVLWDDGSWYLNEPQADGYEKFTYARMDVQEIIELFSGKAG